MTFHTEQHACDAAGPYMQSDGQVAPAQTWMYIDYLKNPIQFNFSHGTDNSIWFPLQK